MLLEAGTDLEAPCDEGYTPRILAAEQGHAEVMGVLIEAGANLDSRCMDGATSLMMVAQEGHMDAARCCSWTTTDRNFGVVYLPLEAAAKSKRSEVVRELLE